MFNFFKRLLGINSDPTTPTESVREILTPPAPYKIETPNEVVITRALAPASNPDVIVTPVKPQRAKNTRGQFVADDPTTPNVNEAWKGGKAPAKQPKPAITEGNTKGGNGAVKKPRPNKKPKGPRKPQSNK